MGEMLIRNLDDSVIARLKRRAEQNRTSAEEEGRRALADSVRMDAAAWRAGVETFASGLGPQPGPTSTELLRADRDRDNSA